MYYQHYIVKCFTKFFVYRTQKNSIKASFFCVFIQYTCFNMACDFVVYQQKNIKTVLTGIDVLIDLGYSIKEENILDKKIDGIRILNLVFLIVLFQKHHS